MNKNIIIGVLVAVIVIAGGYYLLTFNQDTDNQTTPTTGVATTPTTPTTPVTPTTSPVLGIPKVVTSVNVSNSISTAFVSGQIIPNGALTTYWFDFGTTTSLGSRTNSQQIGSGFSTITSPQIITGLSANTIYYFRLSASNSLGTANGNTYTFKTNNNPVVPAAMPTANTNNASSILRTSAVLNGQINPNGWPTNYWFEYGTNNNFGNITSITSATTANLSSLSTVSMAVSSLNPLTKYYFRLNVQNQFGTVNGSTLSFTTQGPLSPGAPSITTNQASNITSSSAQMNGRLNTNGVDTTYWFEYSNNSLLSNLIGGGTPVQTVLAGTNTVNVQSNVSSLIKNTKYYYHLVGKNQYGTVYGSTDSFTTKNN